MTPGYILCGKCLVNIKFSKFFGPPAFIILKSPTISFWLLIVLPTVFFIFHRMTWPLRRFSFSSPMKLSSIHCHKTSFIFHKKSPLFPLCLTKFSCWWKLWDLSAYFSFIYTLNAYSLWRKFRYTDKKKNDVNLNRQQLDMESRQYFLSLLTLFL